MNTFQKSQAVKMLACYITPEEIQKSLEGNDIEKGHPAGYINAHGKQKQADGSWKYVGKGKATKQESKPESNPEQDAIEEHFENKRKNLHETHTKEVDAHYEKMNADSLHHQKLYNDAMKENKSIEELKKLNDAHNESHIKNQEDLKALHSRHDGERSALIKEYSEARKKAKEGSKPKSEKLMTQGMHEAKSNEKKGVKVSLKFVESHKGHFTSNYKGNTIAINDKPGEKSTLYINGKFIKEPDGKSNQEIEQTISSVLQEREDKVNELIGKKIETKTKGAVKLLDYGSKDEMYSKGSIQRPANPGGYSEEKGFYALVELPNGTREVLLPSFLNKEINPKSTKKTIINRAAAKGRD